MFRFTAMWIIIQIKSAFKRVSFYMLTALIALVLILSEGIFEEYNDEEDILIFTGDTKVGEYLLAYWEDNSPDGFVFEKCDDPDEIRNRVAGGEVSCAVLFDDNADMSIPEALEIVKVPEGKKASIGNEPITVIQASNHPEGYFMEELIFPVVQRYFSEEWLNNYLPDQIKDYADELYTDKRIGMDLNLVQIVEYSKTDVMNGDGLSDVDFTNQTFKPFDTVRLLIVFALVVITIILGIADRHKADKAFYSVFSRTQGWVLKLTGLMAMLLPAWIISITVYLLYLNLIN